MNPFFIDLFLCVLTYVILLLIICRGFKGFKFLNKNNQDDEGGLPFEYEKGPILDLPEGRLLVRLSIIKDKKNGSN